MEHNEYRATPMLRLYQRLMAANNITRLANQTRLREPKQAHGGEIRLFCAHDAKEFEEFSPARLEAASTTVARPLAQHA